jgi:hypothetical protein
VPTCTSRLWEDDTPSARAASTIRCTNSYFDTLLLDSRSSLFFSKLQNPLEQLFSFKQKPPHIFKMKFFAVAALLVATVSAQATTTDAGVAGAVSSIVSEVLSSASAASSSIVAGASSTAAALASGASSSASAAESSAVASGSAAASSASGSAASAAASGSGTATGTGAKATTTSGAGANVASYGLAVMAAGAVAILL